MRAPGALSKGVGQGGSGWAQGRAGSWFHRFHGNQLSDTVKLCRCSHSHPISHKGGGFKAMCGKWLSVLKGGQGLPLVSPHFWWAFRALACFLHPSIEQWVAPGT